MSGTLPASSVDEFQIIADLFAPLSRGYPGALNLTDDVALLAADPDHETAATMDAMVAGVHFLPDDPPDLVARKLMRVNLSDLAAKGARPFAVMLAAAFPRGTDLDWMQRFAAGLAADVAEFGVSLIGGDTVSTPGPLTLALTALGKVAKGRAILRSGAQAGDVVWVSGSIGDGALGLRAARDGWPGLAAGHVSFLAGRYRLPSPRLSLGAGLVGLAHAGMDVSDGLVQDLGHICRASGLGARIEAAKVPLSAATAAALATDQTLLASVLAGGDDYELLFTAPAHATEAVLNLGRRVGVAVTAIGSMAEGEGVRVVDANGGTLSLPHGGWRHFSATETGAGA
ncbi:thiamine-phosphate kinase [Magnetospirillum aberrantis]|uniref:Thiamine-monophosphate kinase n=1 Tax=Magnetospirillum aberrantis SpK TaxID=908842 RepID=A0A7C9QUZ0_9PROT|nr:thiamine-phosphate kinase [Magnetospirillum aberrantis]NFV79916.1 thiamine-phosphate kinase [Magnetospirillum aberrantis SpK]